MSSQSPSNHALLTIASSALVAVTLFASGSSSHAGSVLPLTVEQEIDLAAGAFRGTVASSHSYKDAVDGHIYTATLFRIAEPLKGRFASTVRLVERGGEIAGEFESDSLSPRFRVGDEYLVAAGQRAGGTLFAVRGSASARRRARPGGVANRNRASTFASEDQAMLERARRHSRLGQADAGDFSDQSAASFAPGTQFTAAPSRTTDAVAGLLGAIPLRFLQPDRNEPIPYLIDAQSFPAGMTQAQAIAAVHNAIAAWANVSSLKFVYEGLADFGTAAPDVSASDAKIRIQLHDNFNYINSANVLGVGGRGGNDGGFPGGGSGARVGANEFHKTNRGFLVLEHGHSAMQNLKTFEEVLCHEIGHVLGMAHSSENSAESDPTLREAIMFFQAHADNRGATLGGYDPPVIRKAHPLADTPPAGDHRVMDVITAPVVPNAPGINEVELRGYDRQSASGALTFSVTSQTANNGSFAVNGDTLRYAPAGYLGQSPRLDPASTSAYDRIAGRISDGVNASPYFSVRVISFNPDSSPSPTDGLPDAWMTTFFGNADPAAGANRNAGADFDGDGKTNLEEYRTGTSPVDASSTFKPITFDGSTLAWTAKPYEVYQVQSSTDLGTWTAPFAPIIPTGAAVLTTAAVSLPVDAAAKKFYRVERVP